MINLLINENLKIYLRTRTWILWLLLAVAVGLVAWTTHSGQPHPGAWRAQVETTIQGAQLTLAHTRHLPRAVVQQLREQLLTYRYDLRHNLDPFRTNAWKFGSTSENLTVLAMAFILVIAGDIVASEYASGTIKMLLTQTATRTRILVAKYLTTLLFGLATTLALLVVSLLVGIIVFGAQGSGAPEVYVNAAGHVEQMGVVWYLLMTYGFFVVEMVVTATIAFMLSTIFRSSALSITVAILTFLVGSTLVTALSRFSWVKYILFANTNLTQYVVGGPSIHGMTLGFSIGILAAYFIVMLGLSWLIFVRRDVSYS